MYLNRLLHSFSSISHKIEDKFHDMYEEKKMLEEKSALKTSPYTREAYISEPLIVKDGETGRLKVEKFFDREDEGYLRDIHKFFLEESAMQYRHPELYQDVPGLMGMETKLRFPNLDLEDAAAVDAHRRYVEIEHERRRILDLQDTLSKIRKIQSAKKEMRVPLALPDITKLDGSPHVIAALVKRGVELALKKQKTKKMSA